MPEAVVLMEQVSTTTGPQVRETPFNGPVSALVRSGATADRPVTINVGMMFFDTDLAAGAGMPIWWNGTDWVDATGTPV